MDRLVCINVPELPLQILLLRYPEWRFHPVGVVEQDRPQARLLWVNEVAHQLGVLPGMRFAAALGLAGGLKAAVVEQVDILQTVTRLGVCLYRHSPEVEMAKEPGIFWLGIRGLGGLYSTPAAWARAAREQLAAEQFAATVIVGFDRFFTYAIARVSPPGIRVFRTPEAERSAALAVSLDKLALSLGISANVRDGLGLLGVHTLGELSQLPGGGLLERFGPEIFTLHRLVTVSRSEQFISNMGIAGWTESPQQWLHEEPLMQTVILDSPDENVDRLVFLIKRLLVPLITTLAERHQAISTVILRFGLDRQFAQDGKKDRVERLVPATPTLDMSILLGLVRLRLEGVQLETGVVEVGVEVMGVVAPSEQLRLFRQSRRDLGAAALALARLRAWLGEGAVVCQRLCEGHLPEANFVETPMARLGEPCPNPRKNWVLVRRIYKSPRPIKLDSECVDKFNGPFVVSGGWWKKTVHREYYFVETKQGSIDWVYFDKERKSWFIHGAVE